MKPLIDAWAKFLLESNPAGYTWIRTSSLGLCLHYSHPCQGCSQQLCRISAKMGSNNIKYHRARYPCSLQGLRLDAFPTQTILFYDSMIIKAILNMETSVEKWSNGISSHTLGRVLGASGGAHDPAAGEARQRR